MKSNTVYSPVRVGTLGDRFRCFWLGHDPRWTRFGAIGVGVLQHRQCKRCGKQL